MQNKLNQKITEAIYVCVLKHYKLNLLSKIQKIDCHNCIRNVYMLSSYTQRKTDTIFTLVTGYTFKRLVFQILFGETCLP